MICSKCGADKACTPKYFPVLHGKRNGKVCRECRNKRDGHQSPQAGICLHCHKPIIGRPKTTRYHTDEDHPECYEAKREHLAEQQRSYDRGPGRIKRKAIASGSPRKKCQRCIKIGMDIGLKPEQAIKRARLVKKGNRIFCDKCYEWVSRVPEEYQGW